MLFIVQKEWRGAPHGPPEDFPHVFLIRDNWNDFGYRTTCLVEIQSKKHGERVRLASTRVMRRDQEIGPWVFDNTPSMFRSLSDLDGNFCSVSSEPEYYENLIGLGLNLAREILRGLRDAVLSPRIWASFEEDIVFRTSLLREGSWIIANRDRIRTRLQITARRHFRFRYTTHLPSTNGPTTIPFVFKPKGRIPGRINLIVGSNGTGKTQLLARLATAMCGYTRESEKGQQDVDAQALGREKREEAGILKPIPSFHRISFNPFDLFEIPTASKDARFEYTYCGIRNTEGHILGQDDLSTRLAMLSKDLDDQRHAELEDTIIEVLGLDDPSPYFASHAKENYDRLSAGQKIVMNTLSHLIANLKELTLVLLDEPETHLHPTLITTLVDKLHDLLRRYNAFAIIASHSPIVAQQIPSQFVKVLSRYHDGFVGVERPHVETFGETLSELTNALFEAREYERDYTSVLDRLLKKYHGDPNKLASLFDGLGANALRYLHATSRQIGK